MKLKVLWIPVITWILVGCGSAAKWEAEIHSPAKFQSERPFPLILEVKEDGAPVAGLKVQALLEMRKMDHGTVEVDFKETKEGTYEGNAMLPMPGEWVAIVQMANAKQTLEKSLVFEAQE